MTDLELQSYIQLLIKYEENKIKSRRRFEKDLFIAILILLCITIMIMVSCLKIEKYLEEIIKTVIVLEYK